MILCLFLIGCTSPRERISLHVGACGPHAIWEMMDKEVSRKDISDEILSHSTIEGGLARGMIGLFDWRGYEITSPDEIIKALQHYGYSVKIIDGDNRYLKHIARDKRGIALLKDTYGLFPDHYEALPLTDAKLTGKVVCQLYLVGERMEPTILMPTYITTQKDVSTSFPAKNHDM